MVECNTARGTGQGGGGVDEVFTVRSLRRAARNGYGEWLASLVGDQPAWLVTITHAKQSTHPEFSVKARCQWLNDLNSEIFGRRYLRRGDGLLSAFGLEYQKRGTVHQHGILAGWGLLEARRSVQCAAIASLARGFCHIDLPRNSEKAIRYCAKYVSKEGELDIWLPKLTRFAVESRGAFLNHSCWRGPASG